MSKLPYTYWTRQLLHQFLIEQAVDFKIDCFLVKTACYDERWNPRYDFNGCTLIQDTYHPFIACFLHDWRWMTGQGGIKSDLEFKINLEKAGFSKYKAFRWFLAVRIGWLGYYKWKYLLEK